MSTIDIQVVALSDVDNVWPLVAERFSDCLKKTPTDIGTGDFWAMCRAGEAFLIIGHNDGAVLVESVWRFNGMKFTCLLMSGIEADKWTVPLFQVASEIARSNGCTSLTATGRIGLGKMLKRNKIKFKTTRHTYQVEV